MAFTTTIFVRMEVWLRHRPWRVWRKGLLPLSDAVVREIALDHFAYVIAFFQALRALGIRFAALEAPPPRRDELSIPDIGSDALLEIDRLGRQAVAEALGAIGVAIVSAPDDAYEGAAGAGFLRPDFYKIGRDDFHHANVGFGRMMLPRAFAACAELATGRAGPGLIQAPSPSRHGASQARGRGGRRGIRTPDPLGVNEVL